MGLIDRLFKPAVSRRRFLQATATSGAAASMVGGYTLRETQAQAPAAGKAETKITKNICHQCPARCGIDVYTTLNVQHVESLNDRVQQITGVAVRETVPDRLLDEAQIRRELAPEGGVQLDEQERVAEHLRQGRRGDVPPHGARRHRQRFALGRHNARRAPVHRPLVATSSSSPSAARAVGAVRDLVVDAAPPRVVPDDREGLRAVPEQHAGRARQSVRA